MTGNVNDYIILAKVYTIKFMVTIVSAKLNEDLN